MPARPLELHPTEFQVAVYSSNRDRSTLRRPFRGKVLLQNVDPLCDFRSPMADNLRTEQFAGGSIPGGSNSQFVSVGIVRLVIAGCGFERERIVTVCAGLRV